MTIVCLFSPNSSSLATHAAQTFVHAFHHRRELHVVLMLLDLDRSLRQDAISLIAGFVESARFSSACENGCLASGLPSKMNGVPVGGGFAVAVLPDTSRPDPVGLGWDRGRRNETGREKTGARWFSVDELVRLHRSGGRSGSPREHSVSPSIPKRRIVTRLSASLCSSEEPARRIPAAAVPKGSSPRCHFPKWPVA